MASKNVPVLMLDTEMSKEDHLNRLLANISGVPINEIATGQFTNDQDKYNKVLDAMKFLKQFHIITLALLVSPLSKY